MGLKNVFFFFFNSLSMNLNLKNVENNHDTDISDSMDIGLLIQQLEKVCMKNYLNMF